MRKVLFCLLLCANVCYGQSGMWTWMGGDSTINNRSVYGSRGISSPSNKPGARHGSVNWIDSAGNLWLFGGEGLSSGGTAFLNDLWKYDISTNQWSWLKGDTIGNVKSNYGTKGQASITNDPGARARATSWTDSSGNFWLFGGIYINPGYQILNDLWKYNPKTNRWTWITGDSLPNSAGVYGMLGVASPLNMPPSRFSANGWIDKWGDFWLFGGRPDDLFNHRLNDLWKYNRVANQWIWMNGDTTYNSLGIYGTRGVPSNLNKPGGRVDCMNWADTAGNLWLYGGLGYAEATDGFLGDLWKYNPLSNKWVWISGEKNPGSNAKYGTKGVASASNDPGSRVISGTFTDDAGRLWLFGGYRPINNSDFLNDLWRYDIGDKRWTWVNGDSTGSVNGVYGVRNVSSTSNKPGGRMASAYWTDDVGNFWVFGDKGYAASNKAYGELNDLWRYTPGTIVPLHLLTFTGKLHGDAANLQWTSENEQVFSHYEVEKSTDGRKWSKIGSVKAKGENRRSDYQYVDPAISHLSSVNSFFYRLKMMDNDGSFTYSNVVSITRNTKHEMGIYPNPAKDYITIQLPTSNLQHPTVVEISDVAGKVVLRRQWSVVSGAIKLSTDKLVSGSYMVKVRVGEEIWSEKLMIR